MLTADNCRCKQRFVVIMHSLLCSVCLCSDSNLRLFVSRDGTTALSGIQLGNRWFNTNTLDCACSAAAKTLNVLIKLCIVFSGSLLGCMSQSSLKAIRFIPSVCPVLSLEQSHKLWSIQITSCIFTSLNKSKLMFKCQSTADAWIKPLHNRRTFWTH